MTPSAPAKVEVCIIGAGPHGLAVAVHLRRARPDLELVVLDPAGGWLAGWQEQFARAEIEALRSPIVHHPAPDPFELTDYVEHHQLPRSGLPYDPPTTEVFSSFCHDLVESTGLERPLPVRAEVARRDGHGLVVVTDQGEIRADHLVAATNSHRRSIPEWVWALLGTRPGLVVYGGDVDLRSLPDLQAERVVVIGGGLTAAHLACGAVARGAEVQLVTRRPIETRNFDTDPGWLGPRHLSAFDRDDDPMSRLRTAREARGGGTIPPWMRNQLDRLIGQGRLVANEGREVRAAGIEPDGSCVLALDDQTTLVGDRVWLATGTNPDIGMSRCLADLAADAPAIDGLPITDESLRLGPHPVHVMGRLATLALGPAAGNLWGAQRAATRITRSITGVDLEHESIVPVPPAS